MTVAPVTAIVDDGKRFYRRVDFSAISLGLPAADSQLNRTVKIGYDVCSAHYHEYSRQPIKIILRKSSYVKNHGIQWNVGNIRALAFFFAKLET